MTNFESSWKGKDRLSVNKLKSTMKADIQHKGSWRIFTVECFVTNKMSFAKYA